MYLTAVETIISNPARKVYTQIAPFRATSKYNDKLINFVGDLKVDI